MGLPGNLRLGGRMHFESKTSLWPCLIACRPLSLVYYVVVVHLISLSLPDIDPMDGTVDSFLHCVTTESNTTC